jgi:hypothetical protein
MTELSKALEKADEGEINKAIVTEFLQEHDPSAVAEVGALMEVFKGNESEMMETLAGKYSDPAETEIQVTAEVIMEIESKPSSEPEPEKPAEPAPEPEKPAEPEPEPEKVR